MQLRALFWFGCVLWLVPRAALGQTPDGGVVEAPPATAAPVAPEPASATPGPSAAPSVVEPLAPSSLDTSAAPVAADAEAHTQSPEFELNAIATVPSPGRGTALRRVPRNVMRLDVRALEQDHPLGLHDAINRRLGSVTLNDVQNNPLQPDLQYRGFTASPLLGSPQGLAVYQNGVRVNDAFGDIMQWDLIPEFAVHEVQVVPGANPLYGLNALGGGLSLRMKDGFSSPGLRASALGGSFGRHQASFEWGQSSGDVATYAGISSFGERGFRDASRSSALHVYADARQRSESTELGINATLARTELRGNGPLPVEMLRANRSAIFTYPDITRNHMLMVAGDARHDLTSTLSLRGTAYFRQLARDTFNGDEGDYETCPGAGVGAGTVLCDEDGAALQSEVGAPIPATADYNGANNLTDTATASYGGTLQALFEQPLFGRTNQLVVGAGYDGANTDFSQRVEIGVLTPDRTIAGAGIYLGGEGYRTQLEVDTHQAGAFISDTLDVLPDLSVQLSGRLQWARIVLRDRGGDDLNGKHAFLRFDPAVGATYHPSRELTLFASYSESNRAPSAVELSCADPDQPCRLPNAFLGDPPLDQVVTRAAELGARGQLGGSTAHPLLSWSAAAFGSRNYDDIIFVAGSRVGTGFFQNAARTQRIGIELGVNVEHGPIRAYASYSLLRATFESPLQLPGAANPGLGAAPPDDDEAPAADDDAAAMRVLDVEPGDRIPGLPTHSLKAGVTVSPWPSFSIGLSTIVQSSIAYRGDEANLIDDVDGYAIFNAEASYRPFDPLEVFVKVQNLLDAQYETFGVLADTGEVVPGLTDPRFLGPGAPFGIWAGVALALP